MEEVAASLRTPCMVVECDTVQRNCDRMIATAKKLGVKLRPHMKTHKTIECGVMMTGGTKEGIVVSTLAEAEFYTDAGFDDIVYGFPITQDKLAQCLELMQRLNKFIILTDNKEGVEMLQQYAASHDCRWAVLLEVDCGYARTGAWVESHESVNVAKQIVAASHLDFGGLYFHCGNTYGLKNPDEIRAVSNKNMVAYMNFVEELKKEGIECEDVGIGSTPGCSVPVDAMSALTEIHPGNYAFYDAEQYSWGACEMSDIATYLLTRVVGHCERNNHFTIDCGFTALSHDFNPTWPTGYCLFDNEPNLKLFGLTQELGKVTSVDGSPLDMAKYPVGKVLKIFPKHSCAMAGMHSFYHVTRGGVLTTEQWKPVRGW